MALRAALRAAAPASAPSEVATAIASFDAKLDSVAGNPNARGGFRRGQPTPPTFFGVNGELVSQLNAQDNADMAPTTGMLAAYNSACNDLRIATTAWQRLTSTDLGALNSVLTRNRLATVLAPKTPLAVPSC